MATVGNAKLERRTTAVEVARILKQRILAGDYAEDQFIRQELVAQELGVSRIPVREALALLESEGLLVREKYRGAVVPKLSVNEIEQIYSLRSMIEPYLLQHAAANITDAQIEELEQIIARSRRAASEAEWLDLNIAFHRTLYESADKPLVLQMLDNLLTRADRYLKMQRSLSPQTQEESDAEHQRILERLAARDAEGAVAALRGHIKWNAQDMQRAVDLLATP